MVTFSGSQLWCYLNGHGVSTAWSGSFVSNATIYFDNASRSAFGNDMKYDLQSFKVYNRVVSASETRFLSLDAKQGYPNTIRRIKPVTYFLPAASSSFPFHYYQQLYLAC